MDDEEFSFIEKDWVMLDGPTSGNYYQTNQRVVNPFAELSPPAQSFLTPTNLNFQGIPQNPGSPLNNQYLQPPSPYSNGSFAPTQLSPLPPPNQHPIPNTYLQPQLQSPQPLPQPSPPQNSSSLLNFYSYDNVQSPEIKKEEPEIWEDEIHFYQQTNEFFFSIFIFFFHEKIKFGFFLFAKFVKKSIMIDDESSFQLKCILCDSDSYDNLVELNCDHLICTNCLKLHVHSTISDTKVIEVFCPKKCASAIPQYALKVPPCLSFQNSSSFTNSFMWILEYREF